MFDELPDAPTTNLPRQQPRNSGEWIRRFSLRLAELDVRREPKELIELAKRQWMTQHYLVPEQAAEMEHAKSTGARARRCQKRRWCVSGAA